MKRLLVFFFFFVSISLLSCTQADIEDIIIPDIDTAVPFFDSISIIQLNYDSSMMPHPSSVLYWMDNNSLGSGSKQGGDCYQNFFCQFKVNHEALDIYDLKSKSAITSVPMSSLGEAFHCNNADFGSSFFEEGDAFPLVYSSQQGQGARCLIVDRVCCVNGVNIIETIQKINLPFEEVVPLQYTPDAIIDKENGYIYVYAGNTIPITDLYIYKFRLPSISEGKIVQLKKDDILAAWAIYGDPAYYKQGATIHGDFIYILEGVPGWNADAILRVIDLNYNCYKCINLSKSFNIRWEPEDVFFYNDSLFIASNGSGIYLLK